MQNNNPTVSVDFDGVILQLVLGRLWRRQPFKQKQPILGQLLAPFEFLWSYLSLTFRRQIPSSLNSLSQLKSYSIRLYLLTSRNPNDFSACRFWLNQNGYASVFDRLFFNKNSDSSLQFKLDTIRDQKINVHIDDDPVTLEFLAQSLPNTRFIHFRYYHQPTPKFSNITPCDSWPQIVKYLSQSPPGNDPTPSPRVK